MRIEMRQASRTFVVSAEAGICAGVIIAFYLVPSTTLAHTFWSIAGFVALALNCLLFLKLSWS